jgi:MFS superfamily sulfate permease-like transporter
MATAVVVIVAGSLFLTGIFVGVLLTVSMAVRRMDRYGGLIHEPSSVRRWLTR